MHFMQLMQVEIEQQGKVVAEQNGHNGVSCLQLLQVMKR